MTDVAVVIIDYYTIDETMRYIEHVDPVLTTTKEYIVVDNAETITIDTWINENGIEHSKTTYCDNKNKKHRVYHLKWNHVVVHWIIANGNIGYARGNNLGAQYAMQQFSPKYLLITNNDIEISKDTFSWSNMVNVLNSHTDCAAVGPVVYGLDGKTQSPRRKLPVSSWLFFYPLNLFVCNLFGKKTEDVIREAPSSEVYWVSGCFVIIDAKKFCEVGMYDERTFLFCEEMILSERFKELGYKCYYVASDRVLHYQSKTVNSRFSRDDIDWLSFDSAMYYLKQYRHIPMMITELGKSWFAICMMLTKCRRWIKKSLFRH